MAKPTILITGAEGQLGTILQQYFDASQYRVVAPSEVDLSVTDKAQVDTVIADSQPDVIIHTAAATAVDWCETHPDEAQKVNVEGTRHVVQAAQRVGAKVVYLSTDYVFDGRKPSPYVESDPTNPLSVYGQTKLAGEQLLDDSDLIVRTSWLYSAIGNNIFLTLARLSKGESTLQFVNDQRGHPTSALDLAARIGWMIDHNVHGVVHATNNGAVSWFEFAQEVFIAFGEDPGRIEPVTTEELDPPRPAPRPTNSVLQNAVLAQLGAPAPRDFRDTLPELVQQVRSRGI